MSGVRNEWSMFQLSSGNTHSSVFPGDVQLRVGPPRQPVLFCRYVPFESCAETDICLTSAQRQQQQYSSARKRMPVEKYSSVRKFITFCPPLHLLLFITSYHKRRIFWQSLSTKHRTKSLNSSDRGFITISRSHMLVGALSCIKSD